MRYLLIDRVLECKAGQSITGIKNVTMSEDFLEYHFPKNPVMPGVLMLEAICELTGWFEAASSDFKCWFLPTKVVKCNFYGLVLPGDQVQFEVRLLPDSNSERRAYAATGKVDDKRRIKAQFEGELLPLSTLEDVAVQKRHYRILTREFDFLNV